MTSSAEALAAWDRWCALALPAGEADDIASAERLYRDRRYVDALVAGQSLLTGPAANEREQARVHGLVADCLVALGEPRLAARHARLARGRTAPAAPLPAPRSPSAAGRRSPVDGVGRRHRGVPCLVTRPAYWPAERRGRA